METEISAHNINVRMSDMLHKCSDEKAILMAESIAAHRLAGLETYGLEKMLNVEINRMFTATRILNGKIPDHVKYKKYNT